MAQRWSVRMSRPRENCGSSLRSISAHSLRRTYMSIALLANNFDVDVKWVMSQVGHPD
jgi:integrase